MNSKVETEQASALDKVLLVAAIAALLSGIVGYNYFENESLLLRVVGVIAGLAIGALIALQTTQGKALWRFIQSSRGEIRKVIWPTQQETVQTTLMVFVFVLVLGIFFWVLDMGLLWITRLLTGQGG